MEAGELLCRRLQGREGWPGCERAMALGGADQTLPVDVRAGDGCLAGQGAEEEKKSQRRPHRMAHLSASTDPEWQQGPTMRPGANACRK